MAMTREQYEGLVTKLEVYAKDHPKMYKFRILLLALLGYFYIFLILAMVIGGICLMVFILIASKGKEAKLLIYIGIPLVVLSLVILRALWIKFQPPEGIELKPSQAPRLFQLIDEISTKLKTCKPHTVLMTGEINASVSQLPRLGILGWHKNYLTIGLPLMHASTPEQFKSVLAHEFGHLSGAHSRFSVWIYRVRESWYRLVENLAREQVWGTFIFRRFFQWYAPVFGAYSFVLAREHEYYADQSAAKLMGSRTSADALLNLYIKDVFAEEKFWTPYYNKADTDPTPPPKPFNEVHKIVQAEIEPESASKWINKALKRKTEFYDSHPSLSDRLRAIGEEARIPPKGAGTAATYFLGNIVNELTSNLDTQWKKLIEPKWQERFKYATESKLKLAELEKKAKEGTLTKDEEFQRAYWTEEFQDHDKALPLYQSILEKDPNNVDAMFALGRITLLKENDEGIKILEKAMELDKEYVLSSCNIIYDYLASQGKYEQAKKYLRLEDKQVEELDKAAEERSKIEHNDIFLEHKLSDEELKPILEKLSNYPNIEAAFLVKKQLEYYANRPLYVLGVVVKRGFIGYESIYQDQKLAEKLVNELVFKEQIWIYVLNSQINWMKKKMQQVPQSQIYKKN